MIYNTTNDGWKKPTANIAVNRNRLKHYGEKVYLKDGAHFEIELFNPKTIKVLAKIYLNGVQISSSGIVLLPGQRVFLERWLDEPKKFLFETYEVEDSTEAKEAIAKNGKVRVEFYDENTMTFPQITTFTYDTYQGPIPDWSTPSYGGSTINCLYSSSIGSDSLGANASFSTNSLNSIETGRAEKGGSSNQKFAQDSSSYLMYCNHSCDLQILPESQKPVEVSSIRNYCHSCGTRIKNSSWKFCPTCGTQF